MRVILNGEQNANGESFKKAMLEKGTLICVRRKWLWFRETIILERLNDRMIILFMTIQIRRK